jgi:hypothetical protein
VSKFFSSTSAAVTEGWASCENTNGVAVGWALVSLGGCVMSVPERLVGSVALVVQLRLLLLLDVAVPVIVGLGF